MRYILDILVILLSLSITFVSDEYRIVGLPLYDILTVISSVVIAIYYPWKGFTVSKRFGVKLGILLTVVAGAGSLGTLVGLQLIGYDIQINVLMRTLSSMLLFTNVYLLIYGNDYRSKLIPASFFAIALYQGVLAIHQMSSGHRYVGTFDDPNYFGIFQAAVLCILLGLVSGKRPSIRLLFFYAIVVLLGISVLLTFSRGAYLAAFGGLVMVLCSRMRKARIKVLLGLVVITIFVLISLPFVQDIPSFQRFRDRLNIAEAIKTGGTGRTVIWSLAFSQFIRNPFGYGWGTERFVLKGRVSHNILFEVALQYGIIGVFLVVLILSVFFKEAVSIAFSSEDGINASLAGAAICVLIGGISLNMWTVRQFWFFMAVCTALADNSRLYSGLTEKARVRNGILHFINSF